MATGTIAQDHSTGRHRLTAFRRHFLEMFAVMMVGMILAAATFLASVEMTWDEATVAHPVESLLVIAAGMSLPMAAWMLHRRMGVRNAVEMAGAMAVPVVPFLCLVWFGITKSALCGVYCILAIVAMVALMLYRRDQYSMERAH